MRTTSRNLKACAVVILLGIGIIRNEVVSTSVLESASKLTTEWNTEPFEPENMKTADQIIYVSKIIIKTGIEHFISVF